MKYVKGLKNISIFLMISGLLLSGCGTGGTMQSGTTNTEANKTIKIGMTNYYSGKQVAMGKIIEASVVDMALADFNKDAKIPIELMKEDIGDTAVTARSAYDKLLAENPPAILAFINSSNFTGISNLLEREGTPVVLQNTLGTIFEHGWDWIFGTQTPAPVEASLAIKYYHDKLGKNKIAVLVPNDDTGKAVLNTLQEVAKANNITIIPELFNVGDNDFSANILSARRQNPDMYYVNTVTTPDLAKVVKQLRQLGIEEPISVNNFVANADFLSLLTPQEAEGLYGHTMAYVDKDDPKVQDFSKRFKEKTGLEADPTSLLVYDGAMIMFNAVEKAGGDKQKILENLRAMDYTGFLGNYKFDSKGRGRMDTNILQIGPDKTAKFVESFKSTEK